MFSQVSVIVFRGGGVGVSMSPVMTTSVTSWGGYVQGVSMSGRMGMSRGVFWGGILEGWVS